ncbi:hypothetical protein ASG89_29300 [Paenibacillus sp. Soil766]|uniref:hypothetical protein n=1 Tax=Paenibacillus sp. Soil766 TaxID=1736404 RepID=UPI00070C5C73|nr:hypothetical protein [Paenibacillus sp. Soil766]KRE97704.1 hypothetical protein ASG89_29300 [Paenibacillus sp. Soil766]
MALWNLFRKEIKSIFPLFGFFAVAVVALHLIVLYKSAELQMDATMVLTLIVPYLFLVALAIGTGYYQLHVEWRTNSIYLLLSLPIRGWKVLAAKLAAVLSLLIATSIGIGASFTILVLRVMWEEVSTSEDWSELGPSLISLVLNLYWICLLVMLFLLIVVQFTFLCGQLVAKFKWLVMLSAFFGIIWLILRISPLLSDLLIWTPEIVIGNKESDMAFLHSGPFIVLGLLCVGLIALNGFIFEKEVEV